MNHIIPRIVHMAGVYTDSEFFGVYGLIVDLRQFFQPASDLRTFSGHGLQRNIDRCVGGQNLI